MKKSIVITTVLALTLLLLPSCTGAPQKEETISSDLLEAQTKLIKSLEGEKSALTKDLAAAQAQIKSLQAEKEALSKELATARAQGLSPQDQQKEAAAKELAAVQRAVLLMRVQNKISLLTQPAPFPTNDMGSFPDISVIGVTKIVDVDGKEFIKGKDKDGYILYEHDMIGDSAQTRLVNYVTERYTKGTYKVDAYGLVTQVTTGY